MQLLQQAIHDALQRRNRATRKLLHEDNPIVREQALEEYAISLLDLDTAQLQVEALEQGVYDEQYKYE